MSVVLEDEKFCLTLSSSCVAESLILKSNGEECLHTLEKLPFFSLTEERPYNNEIKLAHPNKRTTLRFLCPCLMLNSLPMRNLTERTKNS